MHHWLLSPARLWLRGCALVRVTYNWQSQSGFPWFSQLISRISINNIPSKALVYFTEKSQVLSSWHSRDSRTSAAMAAGKEPVRGMNQSIGKLQRIISWESKWILIHSTLETWWIVLAPPTFSWTRVWFVKLVIVQLCTSILISDAVIHPAACGCISIKTFIYQYATQ